MKLLSNSRSTAIKERVFSGWTWRLGSVEKAIALTFDDGPNPNTTPKLIKTLAQLGIPAVMFVTGTKCKGREALLGEICAAGSMVANHGFEHRSLLTANRRAVENSILKCEAMIADAGITSARLFRPPYGHFNPLTANVVKSMDYRGVMWSAIASDWKPQTADLLWKRLRVQLFQGAIIVLHDGHDTTQVVIDMLPRMAEEIARRGWCFTSLPTSPPPPAE